MAYPDTLTLRDSAAVDKTFERQKQGETYSSFIDSGSTLVEPRQLRILHRREGHPGLPGKTRDRHTMEFSVAKRDTADGLIYVCGANLTVLMPSSGPLVRADLDHLLSFLKVTTNGILHQTVMIDRLLRNET